jgi:tetratricopeptide (TPR) repeat protein
MSMAKWTAFAHADKAYAYNPASLKKNWDRLHRGDCEPFPKDAKVQEAWIAYHAGEFEKAAELGLKAGTAGHAAANKATCIYANYLEKSAATKLKLYQESAARCEALQKQEPKNVNAWYLHAYALGRYSQGISVVKALSQGLGGKVKASLEQALKLVPKHADAHIALGTYHAEIIDKVGAMIGGMTYGAKKETGIEHFEKALKLNPDSAIARIEYANGMIMMLGKAKMKDAEKLYLDAAKCKPMDAMERLDVELAKSELED